MARKTKTSKGSRRQHSAEFKSEALALGRKVGVSEAAAQLKLQPSQLYSWRTKARATARQGEAKQALATENARLKQLLAEKEQEPNPRARARAALDVRVKALFVRALENEPAHAGSTPTRSTRRSPSSSPSTP